MLTRHTIYTFLNSASVNMSKDQAQQIAECLKQMPGLHEFVIAAQKDIHNKERRILGRKVAAAEHLVERLDNARCATSRAIEVHKRAQRNLCEKLELSEHAEYSRYERAKYLDGLMSDARRKACELQEQLCQMGSEE